MAEEEEQRIKSALGRLYNLTGFPFTALELSASVDEEQVAEVFVRIKASNQSPIGSQAQAGVPYGVRARVADIRTP